MVLKSGTPLWATILLALLTLVGGHFLAEFREGKKSRIEKEKAWLKACRELIEEIVNDATTHYCDSSSLVATDLSASKINNHLKRLGRLTREISAENPSHGAQLGKLLIALRDAITGCEDYQDKNRQCRVADDPLFEIIRTCEQNLISNLKKPRKKS